ncbi:type II toxin-antitoxin system RelE/ParE family toxin [uncultured Paraglaciecola sp.]|uniref:type II toxin-antitoxin system RelE/ParE family toxin n=1 Tax=uncultured Paraglaciecola sp. TaxID=1765024 RepID=UPI00262ED1A9|nr:type II toxin-antitoxin system RelE/ParE family toxin [uncultured Paraglaciecola sp.]
MRVQWTDRAKTRLHDIHDYIAKENPKAAREVVDKILRRSWQLGELPDIGHEVEGYEDTDLLEVLVRPYRLIYRKKAPRIDVITVLHYRQLLPGDLHLS